MAEGFLLFVILLRIFTKHPQALMAYHH